MSSDSKPDGFVQIPNSFIRDEMGELPDPNLRNQLRGILARFFWAFANTSWARSLKHSASFCR